MGHLKSTELQPNCAGKELPTMRLLFGNIDIRTELQKPTAVELKDCLDSLNIPGEIERIRRGPVVTSIEFKPAEGVKLSTIAVLNDNIALSLKVPAVRIVAPIPGKDTIRFELPHDSRETVSLDSLVDSPVFALASSPLTLALGTDIEGVPQIADLANMPHLLVVGAQRTGKSAFLNSALVSILFKATPEQVRLLLINTKSTEAATFAELPHLAHPVITDMAVAKNALKWAKCEMDRRYDMLERLGVRDIVSYNKELAKMGKKRSEECAGLAPLPYLVIVIDELADLMMAAPKEVETSIVRLAQLACATGMHMILATQSPTEDVVTGLLKVNVPARISFQVASRHDSRTILDMVGAELLLGKGDMLYKSAGVKPRRLHGAYMNEADTEVVVRYWKERQPQSFELNFTE